MTADTMTEEQIQERVDVLFCVDDQRCQRCGRSVLDCGAADDPRWFIDTEWMPNPGVPEEPVALAIIYCPECW